MPGLEAEQRGEALLDRARAAEAQDDLKTARAKVNEAAATISDDPFYWYFSAALAIRENDALTAKSAIAKALTLAPSDPRSCSRPAMSPTSPVMTQRHAPIGCAPRERPQRRGRQGRRQGGRDARRHSDGENGRDSA